MTEEEMSYPRQFTHIIEENTNFYSHTSDGGNICFASNDDTIEKVWLNGTDFNKGCVSVSVPSINDPLSMDMERINAGDTAYILDYYKPSLDIKCNTVEEIIAAFKTIENKCK